MSENTDVQEYTIAAKLSLACGYTFTKKSGKTFVESMIRDVPLSVMDMTGLSTTGAPGEQPKGFFSQTTYPDMIENETEHGWKYIAERIMRNLARKAPQ